MCFIIAILPNRGAYAVGRLVLGILGKLCSVAEITCLYAWIPEIYPTNLRGLVMGIGQLSARTGSALAPLLVNELAWYGEWIPFVIFGIVAFVAGGSGLMLPETKDRQLREEEGKG